MRAGADYDVIIVDIATCVYVTRAIAVCDSVSENLRCRSDVLLVRSADSCTGPSPSLVLSRVGIGRLLYFFFLDYDLFGSPFCDSFFLILILEKKHNPPFFSSRMLTTIFSWLQS